MLRSLRFASMSSALSASAVLAALAPCLPCHATEVPQAAPVPPVQVVESTPATLVLDVKIEGAGPKRLEFTRPNATASWKLATPLAEDAVVGSDRLPFVDPKALRLRGGKPEDALRLLTPAIGGTKGDRASIVNLFGEDTVICIWRNGQIAEAWFSDAMFPNALAAVAGPPSVDPCQVLLNICCADQGVSQNARACAAAALCPHTHDLACTCLLDGCDGAADNPPTGNIDSCITWVQYCQPEAPETSVAWVPRERLLLWTLSVLEWKHASLPPAPAP